MCEFDGCGQHHHLPPIQVADKDRRAFLAGAASLPLAAVLAYPELSAAAAHKVAMVTMTDTNGTQFSGGLAMPKEATNAPTLVLIHEWWGLNDHIKAVANDFAELGYIALAIDLHGGVVATTPPEAMALTRGLDGDKATQQLVAAVNYLRSHEASNGKVGTIGWCFGGGWSLNASLATPVDATVVYYGNVNKTADQVASLSGPVMGHYGEQDARINREMVGGFEDALMSAGKADLNQSFWYDADHAFANPTGGRFDAQDAALAWERTQGFFAKHLKT